jgi:hypothetical protein
MYVKVGSDFVCQPQTAIIKLLKQTFIQAIKQIEVSLKFMMPPHCTFRVWKGTVVIIFCQ